MSFTALHSLQSRRDFPALARAHDGHALAYLDGPGGSQVPKAVIDAVSDVYVSCNVNTHGAFPPSVEVDRRMQAARQTVATFLGAADANSISFGQNMTTLNFALATACRAACMRRSTSIDGGKPPCVLTLQLTYTSLTASMTARGT